MALLNPLTVWIWQQAVFLLFALSKAAEKELKRQFREREPKKHYIALYGENWARK